MQLDFICYITVIEQECDRGK